MVISFVQFIKLHICWLGRYYVRILLYYPENLPRYESIKDWSEDSGTELNCIDT